jgi:transcriptional regulator with XRE-family HTH domain
MACPNCGSMEERRSVTLDSDSYADADEYVSAGAYGKVTCAKCGTLLGDSRPDELDLARAQLLFRVGAGTGRAFRVLRTALKFRAADLARLFDVRPETISHWENGKGPVDRVAWIALGALLEDCLACRTTMRERVLAAERPQVPSAPAALDALIERPERVFPGEDLPEPPPHAPKRAPRAMRPAPPRRRRA